jgi:hypothetical protein
MCRLVLLRCGLVSSLALELARSRAAPITLSRTGAPHERVAGLLHRGLDMLRSSMTANRRSDE